MLAIIPARGGSKGLPGKNIRNLCGKPLIAYTIEAALKSEFISRVIVSTDDVNIANISTKYGAENPFMRPPHLATDTALSIDVLKYTIETFEKIENRRIEEFMVLQPTSPLRNVEDINNAIQLFYEKNAESVISFCKEHHPIKWHRYIAEDASFIKIFETNLNNRQDEKPSYFPNGAIFIFKRNVLKTRDYYSDKSYAYIMDRIRSIDIDTLEDFEFVEYLIKEKKIINDDKTL
ncbi:MAG: acylneuraminate cytidylyltransferase family protein [Bacteroidia bacterium]|nr:acylneuraminate cytidylyltransferase family protein [Bacteroidia bacterium]